MPTSKSLALKDEVVGYIDECVGPVSRIASKFYILAIGSRRAYLRVTTEKAGSKFWFDISPSVYCSSVVDFLVFACGSADHLYVFPRADFAVFIASASLGGVGAVPNFTIFLDSHEFEPAGQSNGRYPIGRYYNKLDLLGDSVSL